MATTVLIGMICLAAFSVADGAITWTTPAGGDATKSDIKEGTTGNIYTFAATATGALTYTLVSQSVANTFNFAATTGVLSLKAGSKLNFETAPIHILTVRAVESATPAVTSTGTLTISLVNVNEAPAYAYKSVTKVVDAGLTGGATIDTVKFTDEDTGQTVTHAFKSGNGAGDLVIGTSSGVITIASGKTLKSSDQYSLVIKATDSNATPLTSTVMYKLCVVSCNSAGTLAALALMTLLSTVLTYLA